MAIFEEGRESPMNADLWTLNLNACYLLASNHSTDFRFHPFWVIIHIGLSGQGTH